MPDEIEAIGYAVTVIITLGAFIAVVQKFTQPINELKVVIQELKDCITSINKDNDFQNKRLDRHRTEIEDLQKDVAEIKVKMDLYHTHNN